jgi:hypothetical protein
VIETIAAALNDSPPTPNPSPCRGGARPRAMTDTVTVPRSQKFGAAEGEGIER